MKNRIKRFLLWTTVLALLLTGMSAALADTQSATFVLQVRPRPTETPAATEAPTATEAPAVTEAPKPTEAPVVTEAPKPTEAPEATEAPKATKAPAKVTFERNEDGTLALDQNGDPIPVVPEGAEVPVAYQRDENGELVLDKNGDPIVTQTLPAGAEMIMNLQDVLNPERFIEIYAAYEGEYLRMGLEVTLVAVLHGYDNLTYTTQWQMDTGNGWINVGEPDSSRYSFLLDEETYNATWQIVVDITSAIVDE